MFRQGDMDSLRLLTHGTAKGNAYIQVSVCKILQYCAAQNRLSAFEPAHPPAGMGRGKGAAAVLATAPAFTFGSGSHSHRCVDDNGPGPGAYNVRVTGSQFTNLARGGGFGTSGRLAPYGNDNPSPGEYNVNVKLTHKRCRETLVRGRQSADPLKQHQPGPGQYPEAASSVTHPQAPAVSISHRLPDSREAERKPAPGDYTPGTYRSKSPLPVTIKHKRGATVADRPESGHAVPGPGEYRPQDVQLNSRHAPAYTLGGSRHTASRSADIPGPADYSPYLQQRPAAAAAAVGSFGKSEREPSSHYEVRPGPGSYFTHSITQRSAGHSVESLRRSSPSVTIGIRDLSGCPDSNPGPSDYGVPRDALVRASSPCFTFKGVPAKDHLINNPGPGHYNPDRHPDALSHHQVAPAVSISHRFEQPHSQQRRPAPGDYTPDTYCSKSPLPVTIKHKRGATAADRPESGHAVPGPGEYKLPSTLGGPKVTIGLKLSSSRCPGVLIMMSMDVPWGWQG